MTVKLCTLPSASCCFFLLLFRLSAHTRWISAVVEYNFDQVFQSIDRHFTYRSLATDKLSFNHFQLLEKKAQRDLSDRQHRFCRVCGAEHACSKKGGSKKLNEQQRRQPYRLIFIDVVFFFAFFLVSLLVENYVDPEK